MIAWSLYLLPFAGWPSPSLLPISMLNASAVAILQSHSDPALAAETIASLQYAPDPGPLTLRKGLAQLLSSFYALYAPSVPVSHVVTTGGASQSLGVALTVATDPTYTRAWLLEPTYFLAFDVFADAGLRTEGVDVGVQFDLTALGRKLEEAKRDRNTSVSSATYNFTKFSVFIELVAIWEFQS
jgi:DNA-binding transcriptional MocR family regulator